MYITSKNPYSGH